MSSAANHRKRSHRSHGNGYTAQRRMQIRAAQKLKRINWSQRLVEKITSRGTGEA